MDQVPWALIWMQLPTLIAIVAAALWNERRITRIERDVHWIGETLIRRKRGDDEPHHST